jgi:hypothetical protein
MVTPHNRWLFITSLFLPMKHGKEYLNEPQMLLWVDLWKYCINAHMHNVGLSDKFAGIVLGKVKIGSIYSMLPYEFWNFRRFEVE